MSNSREDTSNSSLSNSHHSSRVSHVSIHSIRDQYSHRALTHIPVGPQDTTQQLQQTIINPPPLTTYNPASTIQSTQPSISHYQPPPIIANLPRLSVMNVNDTTIYQPLSQQPQLAIALHTVSWKLPLGTKPLSEPRFFESWAVKLGKSATRCSSIARRKNIRMSF